MEEQILNNFNKKKEIPKTSTGLDLYSFEELENGNYKVKLPGLYDLQNGNIVGYRHEEFDSKEKATEAINLSKERVRIRFEKISLEKGFDQYNSIKQNEDNHFEVSLPDSFDSNGNIYVKTTKKFDNWDDAKKYYLKGMELREKIKTEPFFDIKINENENIAFSQFDKFNPIVAPQEKPRNIPESAKKYILSEGSPNSMTYEKTIKENGWEEKIFSFVASYLKSKEGESIMKQLDITNIEILTPRQAVGLATEITINLTKYNNEEANFPEKEGTKSDNSTVMGLLQDGLKNKNNVGWEGNGICRNFATITKIIFESLKSKQTQFNYLRDTYCVYNGGIEHQTKNYVNPNSLSLKTNSGGHAWNTFITISENQTNSTVVDTTWAKKNLETKQIEGLDYTLKRTNTIVEKIALDSIKEKGSQISNQLSEILSYYELSVINSKNKDEGLYYTSGLIKLLNGVQNIPKFPDILLDRVKRDYMTMSENTDPSEIETLYNINKSNINLPFESILDDYLKNQQFSSYHENKFIFMDDNLQIEVFNKIKNNPKFDIFFAGSNRFKSRINKIVNL